MFDLNNKVVLVTGGSQGIGAKVIEFLLKENIKHVANLDVEEVKGIARQNESNVKYGENKLKYYKCDVTNEEQLMSVYQSVLGEQGHIDVVINNAGIANDSKEKYKKEIEINFVAVTTSTLKAIEIMRKDKGGNGGAIINVSSTAALSQDELLPIYSATKSAILQFSNCVGMPGYVSITGVRVLTICYGPTESCVYQNFGIYDSKILGDKIDMMIHHTLQKTESAASALIEVLRRGESGSTWISVHNKPAKDITMAIKKAYAIMSETLS